MPAQFWQSVTGGPVGGPGSAFSNSTTLTDISPVASGNQLATLPANFLGYVGATLRLTAFGSFSTTGTPTLQLGFYYGGVAGTALGVSPAVTTASGAAGLPFIADMFVTVRTVGTSGTVMCSGKLSLLAGAFATPSTYSVYPMPNATLATVTINTTTANAITLGCTWGAASSSNTITCQELIVESMV